MNTLFEKTERGTYKVKVINVEVGELFATEDGFYQFWPEKIKRGYWPAWLMRVIADKLDEINEPWERELESKLGYQMELPFDEGVDDTKVL